MNNAILRLYDYLRAHRIVGVTSFVVVTMLMTLSFLSLGYKEDISDFLPLDAEKQEALAIYQDISGAGRVFALFECADTASTDYDALTAAVDAYVGYLQEHDDEGLVGELTYQIDEAAIGATTDFVYSNIPYFLTNADYERMERALQDDNFVGRQLHDTKQLLMLPTGALVADNFVRDPLSLFAPAVATLADAAPKTAIESYDGYILTPDAKKMVVMLTSPFGNSETDMNTQLVALLDNAKDYAQEQTEGIGVSITGAPVIAVGNASQIKADSALSVAIAVVLILALLLYCFRNARNIMLIVVSIGWGWLFALAGLALVHDKISIIVVGISSVILGIAVNYPLHLIAHLSHASSTRAALKEIITPLLIGNITTVSAFCSLLPLNSTALSDLGLFSALLLIGTILFVIIYLPHIVHHKTDDPATPPRKDIFARIGDLPLTGNRYVALGIVAATMVLGWFSGRTSFDSDMNNINYMDAEQRRNMAYFQSLTQGTDTDERNVYVVSRDNELDAALDKNNAATAAIGRLVGADSTMRLSSCARFVTSAAEQRRRIERWKEFVTKHGARLTDELDRHATAEGFARGTFDAFDDMLHTDYAPTLDVAPLMPLFATNLSIDSLQHRYNVVSVVTLPADKTADTETRLRSECPDQLCFDIQSLNSAMSENLSDNFGYIGWACGIIVFVFLWASFGRIELALIAFCPMAISWIWILGLMALFGVQFNIVNIILATFIFGQGDDYTIFITEGCMHEYAYRKKMIGSYRRSIIISALIMFIGIGALILAKHPALRSLAQVTIIGMSSVIFTSFVVPPIMFDWLTRRRGRRRHRPVRLSASLRTLYCSIVWLSQLATCYVVAGVMHAFGCRTLRSRRIVHKLVTLAQRIDVNCIVGVPLTVVNNHNEDFSRPSVIVCNHQSMLDPAYLLSLNHKILVVANERSSFNPVVKAMFKWLNFYTVKTDNHQDWVDTCFERDIDMFRDYVAQGYSIAVFPEGVRNPKSTIVRYHKGAFWLAQQLGVDVLPVFIHGLNYVMPIGSAEVNAHPVTLTIDRRITPDSPLYDADHATFTRNVHKYYVETYSAMARQLENAAFIAPLVKDRYLYKGVEIYSAVSKHLRRNNCYSNTIDNIGKNVGRVLVRNCGYGEMALLMALTHPHTHVVATDTDDSKLDVARAAARHLADNIAFENEPTATTATDMIVELDKNGVIV